MITSLYLFCKKYIKIIQAIAHIDKKQYLCGKIEDYLYKP